MRDILTREEAADYLRISVQSLDRLRASGKIQAFTECGIKYLLPELKRFAGLKDDYVDVEELLAENRCLKHQLAECREQYHKLGKILLFPEKIP